MFYLKNANHIIWILSCFSGLLITVNLVILVNHLSVKQYKKSLISSSVSLVNLAPLSLPTKNIDVKQKTKQRKMSIRSLKYDTQLKQIPEKLVPPDLSKTKKPPAAQKKSEPATKPQYNPVEQSQIDMTDHQKPAPDNRNDALIPAPIFQLTTLPSFLHKQQPVYPALMKKRGKTATVKLDILIDESGKVRSVTIIKSAGTEFDTAAVDAIKSSTFSPGKIGEKPVNVLLRLPIKFKLI